VLSSYGYTGLNLYSPTGGQDACVGFFVESPWCSEARGSVTPRCSVPEHVARGSKSLCVATFLLLLVLVTVCVETFFLTCQISFSSSFML
jgi:hypothetical protein